jgi:DNA helicase-2/ATP-dependent DNA helicase PcrA
MTTVDEEIAGAIDSGKSFILDAGAGAGKTYSLVEALRHLLRERGSQLKSRGQQIACITFTNVAKDEISERIGHDPLVRVSTIHDFLWDAIAGHQRALRRILPIYNLTMKPARQKNPDELVAALPAVAVTYSDRGSNLLKGRLHHDDVLHVARLMFTEHPILSRLTAAKFPFLFVDEYQDTSRAVIETILGTLLPKSEGLLVVGFFGDKLQNIYHGGEHPGGGEIPVDLAAPLQTIVKTDNRRCSRAVINVLNRIRTDIEQVPAADNAEGSAIYIQPGLTGQDGLDRANEFLAEARRWPAERKELYLTHRLIGRKAGYADLLQLYSDRQGFHKEAFTRGDDEAIAFFIEQIEPLAAAWTAGRSGQILSFLKRRGYALTTNDDKRKTRLALDHLVEARNTASIGSVLSHLHQTGLLTLPEEIMLRLAGGTIEVDAEDPKLVEREELSRTFYAGLFALSYAQVVAYAAFFADHTPYATKHGVKGAEFDNVLVILDDEGANWNIYSFSKYLNGEDAKKNEKRWNKTRNIFYVCCSRPRVNLAVIDLAARSVTKDARVRELFGADNAFFL